MAIWFGLIGVTRVTNSGLYWAG